MLMPSGPLLALDPSSTRTGYAVMSDPRVVIDAGYLAPNRVKDDSEARIDAMVLALYELLGEHRPSLVLIEVPSGKPGGGLRRGAGARLTIYGMAVGELRRAAKEWIAEPAKYAVLSITEREWTLGRSKRRRQAEVALAFPRYRSRLTSDSGGDVSDAIGLCLWGFGEGNRCRRR
jgi:hypothetical protein